MLCGSLRRVPLFGSPMRSQLALLRRAGSSGFSVFGCTLRRLLTLLCCARTSKPLLCSSHCSTLRCSALCCSAPVVGI